MQRSTSVIRDGFEDDRAYFWALMAAALLLSGSILTGGQAWGQGPAREPTSGLAATQELRARSEQQTKRLILGTVIEQRKYSIRVASGEDDFEVAIPDGVMIDQRLDRPKLDLNNRVLTQELAGSQADGAEFGRPIEFKLPLPQPLGLLAEFSHPNERRRLLAEQPKRLIRYRLLPLEQLPSEANGELTLAAEVKAVNEQGQVKLALGGEEFEAELGNRDARLGGCSIADLKPFQSEVEVSAEWIDNRWVAQEILFRQIAPANLTDDRPRLLLLGDEVSLSYLHSLRRQLSDSYLVHHPPENCRGTSQWNRLPLWLGPYRQQGYSWNTIVFNVGLGDLSTSETEYGQRLKETIKLLKQTEAKLVWLSSTPLPAAWETPAGSAAARLTREQAQAKIERLNQIAQDVLGDFPEVKQIDLGSQVRAEQAGKLRPWFQQTNCNFDPASSELVAGWIVTSLDDLK